MGFTIREKNWRYGHDEIDIVAENVDFIVFVEVKTRKNEQYGSAASFVSRQKQRFMIRAANEYLRRIKTDKEARFDIVTVTGEGDAAKLEHLEEAFYPLL